MNEKSLYPLLFRPNLHTVVWGGHRLSPWKGLGNSDSPIGESWEVSGVPSSTSVIANGRLEGCNLNTAINVYGAEILGNNVFNTYGGRLPLLVKFIDADKDLSIQVHPNNEMAQRVHGKMGKSEMWYVIDAKPGAFLYAGFRENITPYEYKKRVADGSIAEVLARHEVHPGDVFYLPAGRVHAICSGILLAEVQQSSDVTYRIFDYNRPGMDGKPRELHTELASQALNFHVEDEYRTHYETEANRANPVLSTPYFSVRVVDFEEPFHRDLIKYDSFIITMCIKGSCRIKVRATGDEIMLCEGNSCLIPASIADYDLIPEEGYTKVLDAFIDNKSTDLPSMVTRFLHIAKK
jgi:mannose-6-phosphate isomerase